MTEIEGPLTNSPEDRGLTQRLEKFLTTSATDKFNSLALDVFRYQFSQNRPFSAFARSHGKTPASVTHWQQIPAVPTSAFKLPDFPLTCGGEIRTTFLTSGTTTETRGSHHFSSTRLYEKAISQGWPLPKLPPLFPCSLTARSPPILTQSHVRPPQ